MSTEAFAEYLSGLDKAVLVALLKARPDVLSKPAPRGFSQLAERLSTPGSLGAALRMVNRDVVTVGQLVAVLGSAATKSAITRLVRAPERLVHDALSELCGRGLAWERSGTLYLPERLQAFWSEHVGDCRPVVKVGHRVLLEDLRAAALALGLPAEGLRKPELLTRVAELMADPHAMVAAVRALPASAREQMSTDQLVESGLVLRSEGRLEMPREAEVAFWLVEHDLVLTGRPDIPQAEASTTEAHQAALTAAQEALRGVATLLDDAHTTPVTARRDGGVGPQVRARLAARLSIPDDALALWIDLAYSAGLLERVGSGYVPTSAYDEWRTAEPGHRWAALAERWFWLGHAPTCRKPETYEHLSPPLPLASQGGPIRRTLLSAARSGISVHGVGTEIDWFFPLLGYEDDRRPDQVAAALREAELLGVIAGDVLTRLGGHLLATDKVHDLARCCAPLLSEDSGTVTLRSDLTAVVSGQANLATTRLLAASAVSQVREGMTVWRFTPASIRAALDSGWTAEELRGELAARSADAVPRPLTDLITDEANRHGHIQVRGVRCCLFAEEPVTIEILNAPSLAILGLHRLAPTVLASQSNPDKVLAELRAAGFSPVAVDDDGTVHIETRGRHQARTEAQAPPSRSQPRLTAATLAKQLAADPRGNEPSATPDVDRLRRFNGRLDNAELVLLSYALVHKHDVVITYVDNEGHRTTRKVQPRYQHGRQIDSWCYLRAAQRDFSIGGIESVTPTH